MPLKVSPDLTVRGDLHKLVRSEALILLASRGWYLYCEEHPDTKPMVNKSIENLRGFNIAKGRIISTFFTLAYTQLRQSSNRTIDFSKLKTMALNANQLSVL